MVINILILYVNREIKFFFCMCKIYKRATLKEPYREQINRREKKRALLNAYTYSINGTWAFHGREKINK